MLNALFLQILNMSFTASVVILLVLVARFCLKKAPKIFSYALWSVVLFRLLCPFSIESIFSLLPTHAAPIGQDILYATLPEIDTGITVLNQVVNAVLPAATPYASVNPLQLWATLGSFLWVAGMVALLVYSLFSLAKLHRTLQNATPMEKGMYYSDTIDTAFVLGIIQPAIYLPQTLSTQEREYILLHERTHIQRFDHIIKIVSFVALCIHWFNPLVWVAFFASSKDMEMSCDEAVIRTLGSSVKKEYSASLLALATGRHIVGGTPLAFGEGDTKSRVQNVLNYKKPAFWGILIAILAVAAVCIGLVTNPKEEILPATAVDILWESRTPYVGDNTAVGQILNHLTFPKGLEMDGFALSTGEVPYGITVQMEGDSQVLAASAQGEDNILFQKNAILLFSLIENVDEITFTLGSSPQQLTYTRPWAENLIGHGSLYHQSETPAALDTLLQQIAIKGKATPSRFEPLAFYIKPDESNEVMAYSAVHRWLQTQVDETVPAANRIASYEIINLSVAAGEPLAGQTWEDMAYHYVVQVKYTITTATEEYFSSQDGIVGQGTFEGLTRTLPVKSLGNGHFEVVGVGTVPYTVPTYLQSLTPDEQLATEILARSYFTANASYEGVVTLLVAPNDDPQYRNERIEGDYAPGNIIIYKVLTGRDQKAGNPERSISIARTSAEADWEVINQGF